MVVIKSDFVQVNIPDPRLTVTDVLFGYMKRYGNETSLVDSGNGNTYSFRDVIEISKNVAKSLSYAGLHKGDVLVYCCPNNAETVFATLGTLLLGGVVTGVNSTFTADEILCQLKDCNANYCVTVPESLPKVLTAADSLSLQIKKVYVIGSNGVASSRKDVHAFDELLTALMMMKLELPAVGIDPRKDPAFLPYSSGTTGVPKGVILTHYSIVYALEVILNSKSFLSPSRGSAVIGMLPFFHMFGQYMAMMTFREGSKLVIMPKYENTKFLELMQDHKVNYLATVPPILIFLAKHPLVSKYNISGLRKVLVGAAPVGKEITECLVQRHPNIRYVCQLYGMTELSGVSHHSPFTPVENQRFGSCGKVATNVESKVVDVESGVELGAMQDGEVCVRSPTVMQGYLNRLESTDIIIAKDGWVHTVYGMTELSGVSHHSPFTPVENQRFGSCGKVATNVESKVVDVESGVELGAMQDGEVCVRSPTVMQGYLNRLESTDIIIAKDGWVHTGDIGHFDKEHNFYIVDRLKELIKVKGFQVAPAELEDLLLRHDGIADCAVIGVPDEYSGELPRAYIVLDSTKPAIGESDVHYFVNAHVAPYKQLKGGVVLVDQIPKSPSGKILRRELRKQCKSKL